MSNHPLFRKEVFASKRNQNYGTVLINIPIRYAILTAGFVSLACLITLFLMCADYAEKFLVTGFLDSTKSVLRVYPKQNGVIAQSFCKQGVMVKKGARLFLIDTSYDGLSTGLEMAEHLQKRLAIVEREIRYKQQHLNALKTLKHSKYISLMEYNAKKEELMELENKKASLAMEITGYIQSRSYAVRAPIDGIISSVMYKQGQHADVAKPLVKITPIDSKLIAHLFIPAKKAGFIKRNSTVMLHYDAYPFERFGSYKGQIKEISQSIMTDDEEEKPIRVGEPYYKAMAVLDAQHVKLYGKEKPIQNGMTFSAVIVGSKRKIWQWILDPLYSYYGGLFV